VYDLLPRHLPQAVAAAQSITGQQARETLLLRYLRTVIAATPREVCRLFGWQSRDVERLTGRLGTRGQLHQGVRIKGLDGEYLVSAT
jgi:hypothetical protein